MIKSNGIGLSESIKINTDNSVENNVKENSTGIGRNNGFTVNNTDKGENNTCKKMQEGTNKLDPHSKNINGIAQNIVYVSPDIQRIAQNEDLDKNSQKQEPPKQNRKRFLPKQKHPSLKTFNESHKSQTKSLMVASSNNVDQSKNLSTNSLTSQSKPRIFSAVGDETGLGSWIIRSQFDDLTFKLVPLTVADAAKGHCELLDKIRKMKSIPDVSSYKKGDSFVDAVQASSRQDLIRTILNVGQTAGDASF